MKRLISFFCIFVIMISLFSVPFFGAEKFETRLDASPFATPSNIISVTFSVFGNAYRGAEGTLSFDKGALDFLSVSPTEKDGVKVSTKVTEEGIKFILSPEKNDGVFHSKTEVFTAQFLTGPDIQEGNIVSFYSKNVIVTDTEFKSNNVTDLTLNVNISPAPQKDLLLKSLSVKDGTLSPRFSPEQKTYFCKLPYETERAEISAQAFDSDAKIRISDTALLPSVKKDVTISVEKDGKIENYVITFLRESDKNSPLYSDSSLDFLEVENCELDPAFDSAIFDYVLKIPYSVKEVSVKAVPKNQNAFCFVEGDGKVEDLGSVITVTVIAEDGISKSDYRLLIEGNDKIVLDENGYAPLIVIGSVIGVIIIASAVVFIVIRKKKKNK